MASSKKPLRRVGMGPLLPIDDAPAETERVDAYHADPADLEANESGSSIAEPTALWHEIIGVDVKAGQKSPKASDRYVDVDHIEPNPFQPRLYIPPGSVESLKDSMNSLGQIHSAPARPHPTRPGHFQLAGGNRRLVAVQAGANAGIKEAEPHLYIGKLRLDVREMSDEEMLDVAFDENEQRENFSVFDRANYYTMVREMESEAAGLVRKSPERCSLVSNAQGAKSRGAAETEDGLLSWEALVAIRKEKGKALPSAKTLRRVVSVLELPEELILRLTKINLVEASKEDETFEGVKGKHALAVRSLPTTQLRNELIAKIEAGKLSANAAETLANETLEALNKKRTEEAEREARRQQRQNGESSSGNGGQSATRNQEASSGQGVSHAAPVNNGDSGSSAPPPAQSEASDSQVAEGAGHEVPRAKWLQTLDAVKALIDDAIVAMDDQEFPSAETFETVNAQKYLERASDKVRIVLERHSP